MLRYSSDKIQASKKSSLCDGYIIQITHASIRGDGRIKSSHTLINLAYILIEILCAIFCTTCHVPAKKSDHYFHTCRQSLHLPE